ncbi:DUF2784 domain-containing protein [Geodermatophilus sp. YIM 151500]|uniref:DUF2784 domain-containing protein n=1 Tax=Geodermatophilus sp. YIM 151500 TaxID=2984531 RepID=UPI0021E3ED2B|nr:DUF2784 domain-containing protein [Geodermatophilus sp. YIM 151500]MCV2487859.1 DUF2784 domain-containing protein [Geodermatophilus sp. YIM 151500]
MLVLASAVAALHFALVLFVLTGSLVALRWPRLLCLHAPVALVVLAVNLAGEPCPLTVWELDLRAAAGAPLYPDGFIDHYFLDPFGADVHTTAAQIGIYAVALTPNLVGYALHAVRAVRTAPRSGDPERSASA